MKLEADILRKLIWTKLRKASLPLLGAVALVAGCAHEPPMGAGPGSHGPPPGPPPFFSGPMASMLGDLEGFRAHLTMEVRPSADSPKTISGELVGRGPKLLFTPQPEGEDAKRMRKAGIGILYDVAECRGTIFSDALQGCAPISGVKFTKTSSKPSSDQAAGHKIDGHTCTAEEVSVAAGNGATATLQVWRATDLKGFPIKITTDADGVPMSLAFSRVRLELPPAELFHPPEGFTQFKDAETMMGELVLRQQEMRRKPYGPEIGDMPPGDRQVRRPTDTP